MYVGMKSAYGLESLNAILCGFIQLYFVRRQFKSDNMLNSEENVRAECGVQVVQAPVALAMVKLLKLLPEEAMTHQLPQALQGVAHLLRNRLQRIRCHTAHVCSISHPLFTKGLCCHNASSHQSRLVICLVLCIHICDRKGAACVLSERAHYRQHGLLLGTETSL